MAKRAILHFTDANMAGYEWAWTFFLNKTADGKFTVSCKQTVYEDSPQRIRSRRGLRDGVDVFDALRSLVWEAGYTLSDDDLATVAGEVKQVEPSLVDDFLKALSEQQRRGSPPRGHQPDQSNPGLANDKAMKTSMTIIDRLGGYTLIRRGNGAPGSGPIEVWHDATDNLVHVSEIPLYAFQWAYHVSHGHPPGFHPDGTAIGMPCQPPALPPGT
jgi:hypothetical protein